MAGVAGAAADAEDEQPSAAFAHAGEFIGAFFNGVGVQLRGDLLDFVEKLFGKAHGNANYEFRMMNVKAVIIGGFKRVSSSAKPAGEPIS